MRKETNFRIISLGAASTFFKREAKHAIFDNGDNFCDYLLFLIKGSTQKGNDLPPRSETFSERRSNTYNTSFLPIFPMPV